MIEADETRQLWLLDSVGCSTMFLLICVTFKIVQRCLLKKDSTHSQRKQRLRKRIWWLLFIILIDALVQLIDIDRPFDPYEMLNLQRDFTMKDLEIQYQLKSNQRFSEQYPEEKVNYISTLNQAKQCVIEQTLNCELFGNSQRQFGYQMEFYTKIIIIAYVFIIRK
ncbi:hypothetical protein pb186bvf_005384 [Paramecium bursaria]